MLQLIILLRYLLFTFHTVKRREEEPRREFDYNPEMIPNPGMGIISEAVQIFPRRRSTTKEWRNWLVT